MDVKAIVGQMTLEQKLLLCTGRNNWQTMSIPGLGVPSLMMSDGTNGVRFQKNSTAEREHINIYDALINFSFDSEHALQNTYEATCFPTGSALACAWDPDLAAEIGAAVARECKAIGIGLLLGPGMNIRRHPLTARNFEYYSEDPVLAGDMAAGMVNGVQGEGVGATLKHFVCNNSDTRRTALACRVEERALREIYLAGYERAIAKAKPAAVMGSYPAVNGDQCCESRYLLTDILRGEWGFEGITVSDWGGVKDSAKASWAGLDLQMPFSQQYCDQVSAALEDGSLAEAELDVHCERLLELAFRYSREGRERPPVDWDAHHALARKAAARCAVLLRNEKGILPLDPAAGGTVAVLGGIAKAPLYQGTGCAVVHAKNVDIPLGELHRAAPGIRWLYADGYTADFDTTDALIDEAVEAAKAADAAIVMVGSRLPAESDEYDRPDMNLEEGHRRLVEAVSAVQPNTVVVLCNGDAVAMPWAGSVAAILDMWYAGEGSGGAVADLLFGAENPSGKLAVTIPERLEDTPAYLDFPHEQDACVYREGVFVGYRYYDKRRIKPLYPFGHGLSYTGFRYDAIKVEQAGGDVRVRVEVSNTGCRAGAEIVQLYVAPGQALPYRPEKELKAFARLELASGESAAVTMTLTRRDFAWYNDRLARWQVDGGSYRLLAGGGSASLPLEASVELCGDALPVRPLRRDSHYTDLFRYPAAADVYFAFLVEQGLLLPEQVVPELQTELQKTFWGFSQHLDMLAGRDLPPALLEELLERMNSAIGAQE